MTRHWSSLRDRWFSAATISLLLASSACSESPPRVGAPPGIAHPESATWTPATAWRLSAEPILHINGSAENADESPLDPVSVFQLRDGRYVVADGDQNGWDALLIYDQTGTFVQKAGRQGQGPGEFSQLYMWGTAYRGDSIAAFDFVDSRVEVFTPDGRYARSLVLPGWRLGRRPPRGTTGVSSIFIGALRDGRVLHFLPAMLDSLTEGPVWYRPDLVIYDADGQNPRKIAALRTYSRWWNGQRAQEYMFQSNALTVAGQDAIYHATGDDFTVQVLDTEGRLLRTLHRPHTPEPVTPDDRENLIRHQVAQTRRQRFEGGAAAAARTETYLRERARYAEWKPVYSSMVEDADRNLWVEHYRWYISDQHGPEKKPGRFGFWQDEFDVEHVRVYSLIKPVSP